MQYYGVFSFDFSPNDLADGYTHIIRNNYFELNVCGRGCAYSLFSGAHQFLFEGNIYQSLIAYEAAAVFDSNANVEEWPKLIFIVFRNEQFRELLGGAINVKGVESNVVTIIEDSVFRDNIGPEGASINLEVLPGALIAQGCEFTFTFTHEIPEVLINILIQKQESIDDPSYWHSGDEEEWEIDDEDEDEDDDDDVNKDNIDDIIEDALD